MVSVRNVAKERLEAGELALGIGLRQARTVDIGKAMKTVGYDFLFIDMEHNSMSIDLAGQISVAAQDAGITPLVRVPGHEPFHASRALDAGAQGIVVPHVDTAEVAARMVAQCRYPPDGHRSVAGALPQLDFASHPTAAWTAAINRSTLLVLMIESPQAVAAVDAIAAVPGFDVLLVGTNDLCLAMGIPGELDHPRLVAALERIVAACRAHGKRAGLGGVYEPAQMARYIEMGFRFVQTGADLGLLIAAARERVSAARRMLPDA
jgi:2-keto-3-deoxy-L-rhamnonate aldolase RhmA